MFHPGTSALIETWSALPEAGRIPARAHFDPMSVHTLLPRLWSAQQANGGAWTLRLAGGWLEKLDPRAAPGVDWLALWRPESRPMAEAAVTQAIREARPVVLIAESVLLSAPVEVTLAPLRDRSGAATRLIGLYQPTDAADLAAENIGELSIRLSVAAGDSRRAPLSLATLDGRRIA